MYIVYNNFYLKHYNGPNHPENAGRLTAIKKALDKWDLNYKMTIKTPRPATDKEIEIVHDKNYIKKIKDLSKSGSFSYLDPDTAVTEYTYECALLAAGGCFTGLDLIFDEKSQYSKFFALVRPPGHHAFKNRGSGFCIFNNIALTARYAQIKHNIKKITIIDFDAHHGNGTQNLFYEDSSVFYISFHQYPHYPGTGDFNEIGIGNGRGFNLNFPFVSQTGEADYLTAMIDIVIPLIEKFKPELFLVSAGYDSHLLDPLSSLTLVEESYYKLMYIISYLSYRYSAGRTGILLEGGYDYNSTASSVLKTIQGCFNDEELINISSIKDLEEKININEDYRFKKIRNKILFNKIKEIFKV